MKKLNKKSSPHPGDNGFTILYNTYNDWDLLFDIYYMESFPLYRSNQLNIIHYRKTPTQKFSIHNLNLN